MREIPMKNLFQKRFLIPWIWIISIVFFSIPANARTGNYSAEELDTLVSTIALYPDPLLAHVLTAATHNDEIPSASLWANSHKGIQGEALTKSMERDGLDYDPSVLALIPFPSILATMAKYSTWTSQLGSAVANQNGDVMLAVQRMRHTAYDHGNLKTDQYVKVNRDVYITIEPVQTQYIYVPVYNPSVVYYVHSDRYVPRYHYGVWTGHWYNDWTWNDCWFEWHTHSMRHHPRPPRPHHYAPPPQHGGHAHSAPVRPRPDHRLPASYDSRPSAPAKVLPKQEASNKEPQKPAPQYNEPRRSEGPFSNSSDLSRNKRTTSPSYGNSNEDDRRNDDRRNSGGGFSRSIRR